MENEFSSFSNKGKAMENDEYYVNKEGFIVFTEKYHLKRGFCCQSGCKHCPWKEKGTTHEEKKKD